MSNRLTKIITRGGDKGETSLGDGARVMKNDPRIALLGDVDELNSVIGVALAHDPGDQVRGGLAAVQHDLFDLGGALCFPGVDILSPAHLERLEKAAEGLNADLAPLKEFILPGGAPLAAHLHVARTVCRRVERAAAAFAADEPSALVALQYLNRLSDYLFIAARFEAKRLGAPETLWRKQFSVAGA